MATPRKKGKLSFLLLLLFVSTFCLLVSDLYFSPPRFSCLVVASESDPSPNSNSVIETDSKNENPFEEINNLDKKNKPDAVFLKKHQLQLQKLEELVQNLTHLVARLESQFTESTVKVKTSPLSSSPLSLTSSRDELESVENIEKDDVLASKEKVLPVEGLRKGARDSPRAVLKYNTFWSEKFQFVSAVKLRSSPTCVNVLPYRDIEGLSKYFAVGDDKGKLYVFLRSGDVSLELDAFSDSEESSPITAIVSALSIFKNESVIVTGHENGVIVMHRIWEIMLTGDDLNSLRVEKVGRFEMPEGSRINILEVHHVGRKKYILATNGVGKITVFKEDGKLYGSVTPSKQPIAFLKQRLLFLTETGAGSLDLRTMKLKETECEGFNNSFTAKSYVFDSTDRSKAYGFTSEGDLVHTLLLGDVSNFKCRVRSKRKFDMDEPMALQAIRGYLLIANKDKVFVYNVSTQHYVRAGGLRLLFSASLDEIIASFLNQQAVDLDLTNDEKMATATPLIASDHEKIVVISLGNGYVAMYRSNLPVIKNEFNSILWTSPVLFFIIFLFVAWHFFANKKDALTSWGPDDPFSTSGTSLGPGERLFSETSRNSEIMELRGSSGLRGSTRYVSPPRYAGATANAYRPGNDVDSRPSPVDPRFRTPMELKYRGPHVEVTGMGKRRDTLFGNGQVMDDHHSR